MNGSTPPERPYLDEPVDDAGNAMCLFKVTNGKFKYNTSFGWMYWNGRYYSTEGAEQQVDLAIRDMLRQRTAELLAAGRNDQARKCIPDSRVISATRRAFDELVYTDPKEFDTQLDTLNCKNGEVDLRTGRIKPHDPSMLYTYCIDTEYDPHTPTDKWEEWLESVVEGGKEMVRFLQILCGYTFTGLTPLEMFVYLWGPTRSGKGTFTETLLELAGWPLGISAMMSTFTGERRGGDQNFDLAPFKAARLVIASETEKSDWLSSAKIKNMTGGEPLTCAFKHKDQFTYRPKFVIWLVSNHPIQSDAEDDGFWGRARVVTFPHSYLGKEDYTLKERMKQPENLRAVLNWIVWGAVEFFKNNLVVPKIVRDQTKRARDNVDFVGQWFEDNVSLGTENEYVAASILYKNYAAWCEDLGVTPKKQNGFSISLRSRGIAPGVVIRNGSGTLRVIYGIKLNS